ncbi:MAG: nucleotidyltransferase domain-containing protein [Candidatus Omnitrophota bacterium]
MNNQNGLAQFIQLLRQEIPALRERYHVESLSIFGSYVRHEQHPGSDLDILVTFRETPGLSS